MQSINLWYKLEFVSGGVIMLFILSGSIGFVLMLGSDFVGIKKQNVAQYLLAFFGTLIIVTSSILILLEGNTYQMEFGLRLLFGAIGLMFLFFLVYSVLIEVKKNGKKDNQLVTSGTYALSRHPGVLWLFFYYLFGSLFFANIDILIAGIVWSLINVLYVVIQEKVIFSRIFSNYENYKEETPMLLPTIRSIKKCLTTLDGGKNEKLTRNA